MDSARAEIKVGATVLAALIILVAGLVWLKGFRLERSRYRQDVWFPNIGTLTTGDPVSISGVTKGKVAAVTLDQGGVRVTLALANEVVLHRDACFTVKNVGLMGERFVDVQTGVDPEVLPRDSMPRGEYDTGIPEVMGMMGRMTADVRDLLRAIRATVGADTTLTRLTVIAANLEEISRRTSAMVERHQDGIDGAVTDLSEATRRLRATVEANEGAVARAVQRADSVSTRILAFADRLDSLAAGVQEVVSDLRSGDGTLPRLIHDDQLLRRWEETVAEIDALVADIRANPRKYLKVNVSLF